MTPYAMAMLKEFHNKFAPNQRDDDFLTKTERRYNLITEEYEEVTEALTHLENARLGLSSSTEEEARADLAKELADLLYVVYGTAEEFGIPMEAVFKAVHESNMSKVWDDGKVHYRSDGKVLKPPTYKAPDIASVLYGDNT